MNRLIPCVAVLAAALSVQAQTFSFDGVLTDGSPVFNRPLASGLGLSDVGTSVRYDTYGFTIPGGLSALFSVTSAGTDTFSILYSSPFNPADPLANFITASDDRTAEDRNPLIEIGSLPAGTYDLVVTTYAVDAFGSYHLDASFTAVPEPPEWATVAGLGLLGLGIWRRRRA
jgi:hypothetical protein